MDIYAMNNISDFIRKYGLLGSIAILVPFVTPYINGFLLDREQRMLGAALRDSRAETFKEVRNIVRSLRRDIRTMSATTSLTSFQTLYIMRTAVGYQSIYKVAWIKEYLKTHKNSSEARAKQAIRLELVKQSAMYIQGLNNFSNSKIGKLGDYVATNFPMDEFLNSVYVVCLSKETSIYEKGESVMYIMLTMQNDLWAKAKEDMK